MRVERRHGGFICVSVKSTSFPEKRGEDDASWWKWCKSLSPTGNTKLMWVTTAKTSKKQRQKGHLKDKALATPQMWREPRHQNICYTWVKIWVIGDQLNWPKHTFLLCFSIASLPPWVIYIYIYQAHSDKCEIYQTDLVDDGEDGVDQHQVLLLERQVVGMLQSEQHRSYQGDLGGA